jgi:hypothetical protein
MHNANRATSRLSNSDAQLEVGASVEANRYLLAASGQAALPRRVGPPKANIPDAPRSSAIVVNASTYGTAAGLHRRAQSAHPAVECAIPIQRGRRQFRVDGILAAAVIGTSTSTSPPQLLHLHVTPIRGRCCAVTSLLTLLGPHSRQTCHWLPQPRILRRTHGHSSRSSSRPLLQT